jgi:O6-methylguanine-DNA--protein-cysteine methyltransferase
MNTLLADLESLRVPAPPSVGFGALVAAGLADHYAPLGTPLGTAFVAWNGRGVSWVGMAEDGAEFEARFSKSVGRPIERADALPERMAKAIERRLDGDRRNSIPLDLRGHTPFEVMVWMKALEIPRGEVRPYGWIAAEIGKPKAVRAVGTALAHNPVPLVVPATVWFAATA